jgi:hypothetical protein
MGSAMGLRQASGFDSPGSWASTGLGGMAGYSRGSAGRRPFLRGERLTRPQVPRQRSNNRSALENDETARPSEEGRAV